MVSDCRRDVIVPTGDAFAHTCLHAYGGVCWRFSESICVSKCSCCGLDSQFEFLSTMKLAHNPMAGLHNTSENFWVGKVCLACAYNVHASMGETCQYGRDRHNVIHRVFHE